ncbi:IBR finger domain-containing protein [Colletotrichum plurivorum]|uniref:RBR-type E3 ubiquitin transferase n=1 Tax=Colletotrichum plurivorum TaxID=2175906 RepID=A0A8H6K8Q9_9PEZI|nr:IBR finger domain-containing protein [Colletotrichum plurivorum]
MFCHDLDDATLQLVIQMQLQDLQDLKVTNKGKHKESEPPDSYLAIEAYESELRRQAQLASDRSMCKSIARANRLDGRIIGTLVAQEKQALRDRERALHLNRVDGGAPPPEVGPSPYADDPPPYSSDGAQPEVDDDLLRKLNKLYVSADANDDILDQPESSSWAASRQVVDNVGEIKRSTCNSCLEKHSSTRVARCPCRHKYCGECLQSLFEAALTDETLFPPRCCGQPIPVDDVRRFLTPKLVGEFRAKEVEFSTPDRTYCHQPGCSSFIPKEFIRHDVARCPRCRNKTCVMCKGSSHQGEDCGQDAATQSLLHVAAENGWQRCFSCRRVVELDIGCNHMTCRCGAEFCYVCGLKGKVCTCARWDEERLVARAEMMVDRDHLARQLDAQRRAQMVQREARYLVENHECIHNSWKYRSGVFSCEECYNVLPQYIYECRQCRIRACRRCRFHRLAR